MKLLPSIPFPPGALRFLVAFLLVPCAQAASLTMGGYPNNMFIVDWQGSPQPVHWQRLAGDPGTPTPISSYGNFTVGQAVVGQIYTSGSADGTRDEARFNRPGGIAVNELGELFISDSANHTIRKMTGDTVTTLAGVAGVAGTQNGLGTAAQFHNPQGLTVGKNGDVYVAEMGSHRIRKISPSGAVTNLAGVIGQPGGVDGNAGTAKFNKPADVAIDATGNLYVADSGNHVIRKISSSGLVSTLAGKMGETGALDGTGTAARFRSPEGVAVDGSGNVYVADTGNGLIRKITAFGKVTTVAGAVQSGAATALGRENFLSNLPSDSTLTLKFPTDIEIDVLGNLYVANCGSRNILKITPAGALTNLGFGTNPLPLGGDSNPIYPTPVDLAVSTNGRFYVADAGIHWIRVGTWANVLDIAPYFVTHPASTSGHLGESVWLRANALATTDTIQGSGSVTYKWFLNGKLIPSPGSGSLLVKLSPSTVGTYHAVASNALGYDTSMKAQVTLKPAAEWEWADVSSNQLIQKGGTASFAVKNVTGPGVIRYQWLKDGRPIAGATSEQLNLVGAGLSAAGLYSLTITTSAGKVTTPPRRLIVEDPGLLIYSIRGTGSTATSPAKNSFSFGGLLLIDRTAQNATFLWQDAASKTYSIEQRDDLAAHSTGPSPGTVSVFSALLASGADPDVEQDLIWLSGTDALITLDARAGQLALAPSSLSGQLNSLTLDGEVVIQMQNATLTLDTAQTLKARASNESLEAATARIVSSWEAAGLKAANP